MIAHVSAPLGEASRWVGATRAAQRSGHSMGVVRDAPVPEVDLALPTQVADRLALDELAARHGIDNPVGRLLTALGLA